MLLAACAGPPPAAPTLFEDAVALAVTPDGTLWAVDAGAGVVVARRRGLEVARLGGVGTGDEAFLDPVDVDPTNGLAVFVADRAGAVLHFTEEARLARTVAVPDVDPSRPARQPAGELGREVPRARPVAVAAGPDGALYVADGARRHVLKLDAEGAVERVLGATAPGVLGDPVDLVVADDGTLYVLDAGLGGVQAFDAFGAAGEFVAVDEVGRLRALDADGGRFLVVGERGAVVSGDGGAGVVRRAGLRGGAFVNGGVALLTATGLEEVGPEELGLEGGGPVD